MSSSKRIVELAALLTAAADQYYNDPTKATMSDAKFDALKDELEGLDPAHPFLSQVGASVASTGWAKVTHGRAMGSLLKVPNPNGFKVLGDWAKAAGYRSGEILLVGDKMDGFSANVIFRNGVFVQAVTRGDGTVGDDITRNAKLMDFPKRLPGNWSGSIRCEGIIKLDAFLREFPGEKNPRTSASGTARRQTDPAACKYITMVGFDVIPDVGDMPSKSAELTQLQAWGFDVPKWQVISSLDDAEVIYQRYQKTIRKGLNYWIDGLVISFDDTARRTSLPLRNNRPLGSVAYKFPAEEAESTLRGIDYSVSRSGRLTPVLMVDPVDVGGSTVARPNAHNLGRIAEMASEVTGRTDGLLYVGDTIVFVKRGDIIPYAEATLGGGTTPIPVPTHCPECTHPLERDGAYLVCRGAACPAQTVGGIERWFDKIGVKYVGRTVIEAMIDAELIEDAADVYTVDRTLVPLLTMGQRVVGGSMDRGWKSIDANGWELDLFVFVGSLGIPGVDRSTTQKVVEAGFDDIQKMFRAKVPEIAAIPGVGSSKANAFVKGMYDKGHLIGKLLSAGVTIKTQVVGRFTGMSALVSGFRGPDEQAVIKAFTAEGGVMKSSVSRGITYLIVKDATSNSGKPAKARQLNAGGKASIEIVDIDGFWANVVGQIRP
jgi:DNA ligase (NAD+)